MSDTDRMRALRDRVIDKQTLTIAEAGEDAYAQLGPKLELRDCTLVLRINAKKLTLAGPRLIRCTIQAKKPLGQVRWGNAYLEQCRFEGSFTSNDFGPWPEYLRPDGDLRGGDFSAAKLSGCRFINTNPTTIAFPRWPCFTLLNPAANADALRRLDWPTNWRFFVQAYTDLPSEVTAITGLASDVIKKNGGSETELKALLSQAGNAIL